MRTPTSTYRLQLRQGVDLPAARAMIGYLERLGVDWLYLSPLQQALADSTHGYDVIASDLIDPALGDERALRRLATDLHDRGMGLLVDIVPNHMSAHISNRWWRDVLEHGRGSIRATFFDIRWDAHPESRLVLPMLGRHYGNALVRSELQIGFDDHGLVVDYYGNLAPLDPRTWPVVLERIEGPARACAEELSRRCRALPPRRIEFRQATSDAMPAVRSAFVELRRCEPGDAGLSRACASMQGERRKPSTFDPLHALLDAQAYRLAYWRSGLGEINYRRFFDVTELVALQADRPEVFEASHEFVLRCVREGVFDGLRVDHVDGLADPGAYLRRLRDAGAGYVLVEKILSGPEILPARWATAGTTGYEFAQTVAWLFVEPQGLERLQARARERNGGLDHAEIVYASKLQVLDESFFPSIRRMADDLRQLTRIDRNASDLSTRELEDGLRHFLAAFDVYRTYRTTLPLDAADRAVIERAQNRASEHVDDDLRDAIDFIASLLGGDLTVPDELTDDAALFVRRFQQLSGPVAAKGVEDTASYRWTALLALSEVGCEPHLPDDPLAAFEAFAKARASQHPASLNATSTHDTKRGEDVRARLFALSEFAEEWATCVDACVRGLAPDPRLHPDEVELVLQTFVGAWPLLDERRETFNERLRPYLQKAAREAKRGTSWLRPDTDHEERLFALGDAVLGSSTTEWGRALRTLTDRVAFSGAIVGLGQCLLKLTAPGVPDLYQGTETWDLNLVDPDNRRPVELESLRAVLEGLDEAWSTHGFEVFDELRHDWAHGRIKTWITSRALRARRAHRELFASGEPSWIAAGGRRAVQVLALRRSTERAEAIALVPRFVARDVGTGRWPLGEFWQDTRVLASPRASGNTWREVLTARTITAHDDGSLDVATVLQHLPVALLIRQPD